MIIFETGLSCFEENKIKLGKQIETLNTELTRAREDYQRIENKKIEEIQQFEKQIGMLKKQKMQVSIFIFILCFYEQTKGCHRPLTE